MSGYIATSKRTDWATPKYLMDKINEQWGPFDLDVCATAENAKAPKFFTPQDDGLKQKWFGRCYMNPPYGREIVQWVEKAWNETAYGYGEVVSVTALLPARTDTNWWHDYVQNTSTVYLLPGRVKFDGAKSSAPFPSAIVVWRRWP